jgi:predicted anti-sigma-YlaC factor YlaD
MDCKIIADNILFYIDKELDSELSKQFEEHLNNCAECKLLYQRIEGSYSKIELVKELNPNPFFYSRLITKLEKNKEKRTLQIFVNALKPLAIAASIGLGIIIGNGELDLLAEPEIEIELASDEFVPVLPSDYSVWITMNEENGNTNEE